MEFFKRFDFYEPQLNFHQTKSKKRGFCVFLIAIIFIILFLMYVINSAINQKLVQVLDPNNLPNRYLKELSSSISLFITITPFGFNISENCAPTLSLDFYKESVVLNTDLEKLVYSKFLTFNINQKSSIVNLFWKDECLKNIYKMSINIEYDELTYHNIFVEETKQLKTNKQNLELIVEFKDLVNVLFEGTINTLHNDYKKFTDFSLISNSLENKLKLKSSNFISTKDSILTLKHKSTEIQDFIGYSKNQSLSLCNFLITVNIRESFKCFINIYQNPLSLFPMFFSIFTLSKKASIQIINILFFKFKMFSFVNDHCCIFEKVTSFNMNSDNNSKSISSDNNLNKLNRVSSILNINRENEDDFEKSKIKSTLIENSNNLLCKFNTSSYKLKGKIKSSWIFYTLLPFKACVRKRINPILTIIKLIQDDIYLDYDKLVSKSNLYIFFKNYKLTHGDELFKNSPYNFFINDDNIESEYK